LTYPTVMIIGNATTNTSSAKFLGKFIEMIRPSCSHVTIVNDGFSVGKIDGVDYLAATASIRQLKGRSSAAQFFWRQSLVQLLFSGALVRVRNQQNVIFFPITAPLPVFLAKLMGKNTFLYEAQDVLADQPTESFPAKVKFFIGSLLPRKLTLELVDRILVEGRHVVEQNKLQDYLPKVTVCPQYVDSKRYDLTIPFGDRKPLIGFIAALVKRKGALEFAGAVNLIANDNPEFRFAIIGNGPLKQEISEILADHISKGTVTMVDSVEEEGFVPLLNQLRLLVLSSTHEGLPNIILEAMSCGTPVLATKVGAVPDVITDGKDGFLVETNTSEDIANGILRAMHDQNIIQVSRNARNLMTTSYSLEVAIRRYREVLDGNIPQGIGNDIGEDSR
jgi:glycosyltransferase involved in cell wall biosynthesis